MKSSQHEALLEKDNQLQGDPNGLLTCTAYFMVMKGLIATGILVLAKGFSRAGWLFSCIALVLAAYFSYLAAIRLIRARRRFHGTYTELGQYAYGNLGRWAVNVTLLVSQFCFNIGHIAFTTSHTSLILNQWFFDSEDVIKLWHVGIVAFCILSVLLQFRNIKTLAIFYILADTLMMLTVILVISQSSERISSQGGVHQNVNLINPTSSIGFIGVAFFAYESIGIYLPVAAKMKNPGQMEKVLFYGFSTCLVIYIFMGILPYFAFGADGLSMPFVTEVILINFHGWYNQLTNLLYGINLIATFTLMAYPAIQVLQGFFLPPYQQSVSYCSPQYREEQEEKKVGLISQNREDYCGSLGIIRNMLRVFYTFCVVLVAVLAAGQYQQFTSLAGALTCTPIAYILPVAFHYKLTRLTKKEKICDLVLIIIGVVGMVLVTTLSIIEWVSQ